MFDALPRTFVRSPLQATNTFASAGVPRQHHTFIVRFQPNGAVMQDAPFLTFAIKHCDRPKVTAKAEELHQYNKKRQIYTGFRLEPVRMTFYDTADGAAQNMWLQYAQYYFGDFAPNANVAYHQSDVTTSAFNSGPRGLGLSEPYKTNTSSNGQWFFDTISIYHFYVAGGYHIYDSYVMYNPRITTFEPDELDYDNSALAMINLAIVYENLQYHAGQAVNASDFSEFTSGNFYGNPLPIAESGAPANSMTGAALGGFAPSNPSIGDLLSLSRVISPFAPPAAYRASPSTSTGYLAPYGYSFGSYATSPFGQPSPVVNSFNNGSLSPTGYGVLNSYQTGTAQYGYTAPSAPISAPLIGVDDNLAGSTVASAPQLA